MEIKREGAEGEKGRRGEGEKGRRGEGEKGRGGEGRRKKKGGQTCMQRSEFVIPPSTASSASGLPLSLAMASRMAFVWKQVASSVARATWPFWV
jgi:hypothetical protein